MTIAVKEAGKRFRREWIFRNLTGTFQPGERYAVTGPNGSGKSTLLKALAGSVHLSAGSLAYTSTDKAIDIQKVYERIAFAAPYLDLVEEFTLEEHLRFHGQFKQWEEGLSSQDVIELCKLGKHADKQLRNFSSGMKQRVRLAMALLVRTEVVFLDEPTTNLDEAGKAWYQSLLNDYTKGKLLFIGSNNADEYAICDRAIHLPDYKKKAETV